jgi:hypothetical protein
MNVIYLRKCMRIINILIHDIHIFATLISHSALTFRLIFISLHIKSIRANHVKLHSMLV